MAKPVPARCVPEGLRGKRVRATGVRAKGAPRVRVTARGVPAGKGRAAGAQAGGHLAARAREGMVQVAGVPGGRAPAAAAPEDRVQEAGVPEGGAPAVTDPAGAVLAVRAPGGADGSDAVIAHVVLFRPKATLEDGEGRALLEAIEATPGRVDTVRRLWVGRRLEPAPTYQLGPMPDFPFASVIEFDDRPGLEVYLAHPWHAELSRRFYAAVESALAFDFEAADARAAEAWLGTPP